jgi:hypothetical protein
MTEKIEILSVPFFDGAKLEFLLGDEPLSVDGKEALAKFLSLGTSDRLSASRHVFAYYQDQRAAFEEDGFEVDSMPEIASAANVWGHVQPKVIWVEHDPYSAGSEPYVLIEADCDWEPEHGLMLCFRWGKSLTKCGQFNGHVTNENARADNSLSGIVYLGLDPAFTTREDP